VLKLEREKDPEILRQTAQLLLRENERLIEKNLDLQRKLLAAEGRSPADLQRQIALLEEQLAQRTRAVFGESSERRSREPAPKSSEPQRGHGRREQAELPVAEVVHEMDAADCVCPECGGALAAWAGQFEESEEIDVVERHFVVKKHRRQKHRCGCGHIETAPGPVKLQAGGRYSIAFAVEVLVGKYLDHLPLERQVRIMRREGLSVDSQTLWDQLERVARLLAPAQSRLHAYVLSHELLGADETHWRLMGAQGEDAGEAKRWFVWTAAATDAVSYRIEDSRSTEAARRVFEGFKGTVVADGYTVYERLAKASNFRISNCWAHVRRKFVEAEPFEPAAAEMVQLIGELYEIDALSPTGPPGDALRAQLRRERSRPVVERIREWLLLQRQRALPQSAFGKAIEYTLGLWPGLTRFLDDPSIPLDNNATERALRGVVLGRKNHYGSRSRRGTEVAALCYSLVESAKLVGLEPKAYLCRALEVAVADGEIPLPHELARS